MSRQSETPGLIEPLLRAELDADEVLEQWAWFAEAAQPPTAGSVVSGLANLAWIALAGGVTTSHRWTRYAVGLTDRRLLVIAGSGAIGPVTGGRGRAARSRRGDHGNACVRSPTR